MKKNAISLLKRMNNILNKLDYEVDLDIHLDVGAETKYEKLVDKDKKFILENADNYINDFENFYISDMSVLEQSTLYHKLTHMNDTILNDNDLQKLALLYYQCCIKKFFDSYYEHADDFEKIKTAAEVILKFDWFYWNKTLKKCKRLF